MIIAPFERTRSVEVLPAGARQVEEPLPLGERLFHIRIGIDEDVAVVEGREQPDLRRKQHAVAEDVAGHVADTGHRKRRCLDVDIHFAEMALDGLPGAAGGDAHLLVVVASRAAGGEGVVEPEAGFLRQRIGGVGEGRRSLVGGDDEIGIVAIEPHRIVRRHDIGAGNIVGDRQQRADIGLVGFAAGIEDLVAAAADGKLLRIEAALGADRHDDGVLDLLRLHEAQHFGAVVLGTIRPAQTAARHLAEAQVHAFDFDTIDEDFAERPRFRQAVDELRIELEGKHRLRRAVGIALEVIGAQRRIDDIDVAAQDAVIVEARHVGKRRFDRLMQFGELLQTRLLAELRIERVVEEPEDRRGDLRIFVERRCDVVLRIGDARLAEIAGIGPQHVRLARRKARPKGSAG